MAAAHGITATEFALGAYRQKPVLPRHSFRQARWFLCSRFLTRAHSIRISRRPVKIRTAVLSNVVGTSEEKSVVSRGAENVVVHFYRDPLLQDNETAELLKLVQTKVSNQIIGLKTEQCFNIGVDEDLSGEKLSVLRWLLGKTYEPDHLGTESFLDEEMKKNTNVVVVEVGPRLSFTIAWSANAVSICQACSLTEIRRLERSRRYLLYLHAGLSEKQIDEFAALVHDRMTEYVYNQKLTSFERAVVPEEVYYIPVMERGRKALEEINEKMGLAFDEQDLQYYTKLFNDDIKRNPTNVELFDIAQSNSEHSRHWFFTGKMVIDGEPINMTLMQIVKSTCDTPDTFCDFFNIKCLLFVLLCFIVILLRLKIVLYLSQFVKLD